MTQYKNILAQVSYEKVKDYYQKLLAGESKMGGYLAQSLKREKLGEIDIESFLEKIIQTKKPKIFAESEVNGDGSDWNQEELSILGDLGIAVPVRIFDNARHRQPIVHPQAFEGLLLFTAGALLRGGRKQPADWKELVQENHRINFQAYLQLYERRLLPMLLYANEYAQQREQKTLITIPGLGCGQFAGIFQGLLGELFKEVLCALLERHAKKLPHIAAIYYDPYNECHNQSYEIGGIPLLVRPLTQGNEGKSQLAHPTAFNEDGYDFSDCFLSSFVAWDHVSWPGNDFYIGARATDDGVKAAATDSMFAMTGVKGYYNSKQYAYLPPNEFKNWEELVRTKQIKLQLKGNLKIYE